MYGLSAHGQKQFDTGVVCCTIVAVAVIVRIVCKLRNRSGIRVDDYWIFVSVFFYWVAVACTLWGSIIGSGGLGNNEIRESMLMVSEDKKYLKMVENSLKGAFLGYTFFLIAIYALKISILYFYRSIFFVKTSHQRASLVMIVISTAWFIGAETSHIFACQPIDASWIPTKPKKCLNFNVMFVSVGTIDTVMDIGILALPIRMAFTLHMPTRTRIAVAGIFALGGFSIITNIVRLSYMYRPDIVDVNFEVEWWSNIHMLTAVVSACLPIYKPMWNSFSAIIHRTAISFRSENSKPQNSYEPMDSTSNPHHTGESTSNQHSFERGYSIPMSNDSDEKTINSTSTESNDTGREILRNPPSAVTYSRSVDVV